MESKGAPKTLYMTRSAVSMVMKVLIICIVAYPFAWMVLTAF